MKNQKIVIRHLLCTEKEVSHGESSVVSDDTGQVFLFCFFAILEKFSTDMFMESPIGDRNIIDIQVEKYKQRGHPDVPQSLCSPIFMFSGPMFPSIYAHQSLCSPVLCSPFPMFPGPMFPGLYVPQSLCSPVPMSPDTYVPQ